MYKGSAPWYSGGKGDIFNEWETTKGGSFDYERRDWEKLLKDRYTGRCTVDVESLLIKPDKDSDVSLGSHRGGYLVTEIGEDGNSSFVTLYEIQDSFGMGSGIGMGARRMPILRPVMSTECLTPEDVERAKHAVYNYAYGDKEPDSCFTVYEQMDGGDIFTVKSGDVIYTAYAERQENGEYLMTVVGHNMEDDKHLEVMCPVQREDLQAACEDLNSSASSLFYGSTSLENFENHLNNFLEDHNCQVITGEIKDFLRIARSEEVEDFSRDLDTERGVE